MSSISRLKCGMTPPSPTVLDLPPATIPTQLQTRRNPWRNHQHRPRVKAKIRTCGTLQTNCNLRRNQLKMPRGHPRLSTMTIGTACTPRQRPKFLRFTLDEWMLKARTLHGISSKFMKRYRLLARSRPVVRSHREEPKVRISQTRFRWRHVL
jgi:hypothetical protein